MDTNTATFDDIDAFLAGDISSITGEVTYSLEVELVRRHISDAILDAIFTGGITKDKYFQVVEFRWKEIDDLGLAYERAISLYRSKDGEWVAARRLDKMIKNRFLSFLVSRKRGFTHAAKVPHEYAKNLILREFGVYKEAGKVSYARKLKRLISEHALA